MPAGASEALPRDESWSPLPAPQLAPFSLFSNVPLMNHLLPAP